MDGHIGRVGGRHGWPSPAKASGWPPATTSMCWRAVAHRYRQSADRPGEAVARIPCGL
ncbi:hypothetical protein [Streptomyces sp. NPDC051098]|uniref:hypothetical protein n=1 Tax=Streptomyces sp. NPDC051098 TaxID=3155411 RepID=UPI00341E5442